MPPNTANTLGKPQGYNNYLDMNGLTPWQANQPQPGSGMTTPAGVLGKRAGMSGGAGNAVGAGNPGTSGGGGAGVGTPSEGVLSGPGYNEDWYKAHSTDMNGPSSSTKLFNEGMAGSNPFYDNAIQQADQQINNESANRGGWNSSSTMNTIGLTNANLRGQQAHELGMLAGQADSADTSRFTAGSGASNTAQDSTENRVNSATNGYLNLSKDQASMVQDFYDMAAKGLELTDMAAIEAQMKASGMSAQEIASVTNDLLKVASIGVSASGGGGAKPP
jgi:hypothetical protein